MNKKDGLNTHPPPPYLNDMSHLKMAIFLADWFDFHGHSIHLLIIHQWVMFLWIDRPMYRTDLFIVNGADLEYTKKTFKVSWWMMLFWSIYIKKNIN